MPGGEEGSLFERSCGGRAGEILGGGHWEDRFCTVEAGSESSGENWRCGLLGLMRFGLGCAGERSGLVSEVVFFVRFDRPGPSLVYVWI